MKNNTARFSTQSLPKVVRQNIQVLLIGVVLVILLIGTFVAVQLSQIQQENRQKASVGTGTVIADTTAPSTIVAGQPTTITFSVNTHNTPINGIQLSFHIEGADTPPVVSAAGSAPLGIAGGVATPSGSGYDLAFAGLNPPPGTILFDTGDSTVQFAQMSFTASSTAPAVVITYNNASNASFTITTIQGQDDLYPVNNASFPITQQVIPTDTPTQITGTIEPSPTETVATATPLPTDVIPSPTDVPNPTATVEAPTPTLIAEVPTSTPVPTATPDESGLGGTTIKYCGEACTAHSDCAVNLLCYSGVCRLANNPTDTSCNNPPDNGIHRVCNEYCADSRECQTGLTCYYNSCRNPRNINDQYCAEPIVYNTKTKVVTNTVIVTATPQPTEPPVATISDNTDAMFGGAQGSLNESLPTDTPWPTYAPVAEVTPEPESDQTMVQKIQGWLKGLLIVAVAISAIFFLLWLIPLFLKRRHDDDDDQPPMPMTDSGTTGTSDSSAHSDYSESLKDKTSGGGMV